MKLAFCVEMIFTDFPFLERLELAAKAGVEYIEFWDWRDKDLALLANRMDELGLQVANFSGNREWSMIDPLEEGNLLGEIRQTLPIAQKMRCPRLMLLVQALRADGSAVDHSKFGDESSKQHQVILCGQKLAELADRFQIDFVIEPLNTRIDHPGYFLDSSARAFDIVQEIDHPRIKILYDVYHMAAMEQPVFQDLQDHLPWIGYIHVADFPGRGYPGSGRVDFMRLKKILHEQDYQGVVGFEFNSKPEDSSSALATCLDMFV